MANSYQRFYQTFKKNFKDQDQKSNTSQNTVFKCPPSVCFGATASRARRRWETLNVSENIRKTIISDELLSQLDNDPGLALIENFIGYLTIPVGIAGPLKINGVYANGDFYVPLATIEPTLVASYSRGAFAISKAGGCSSIIIDEGVSRAPGFEFKRLTESLDFANWVSENYSEIKESAEKTTCFGKLIEMKIQVTGRYVHLIFDYTTEDAMGQNMVTISTDAILKFILEHCPVKPVFYTIEGNMSGDKKSSFQAFQSVRGRKVSADVIIPAEVCKTVLNASPEVIKKYNDMAYIGGIQLGSIGTPGQYANGVTAFYLACGQDIGCGAESSVGITYLDVNEKGDLYASVTMPNIMVGTVGAVSNHPSQKSCLEILDCYGTGKASKLAEICAALCLAGEISIIAALSVNEFTSSHKKLARKKR